MPQIRQNINDVIYFITSCTTYNKKLFSEREFCEILIKNINFYKIKLQFRLYAFCIIPWYFHLLIMPDKINVSKIMQLIKYRTASDIRKHRNLSREPGSRLPVSGTIWQKSFYDKIIRSNKELHNTINYIDCNAVKHGLVDDPINWKYSSYHNHYDINKELIKIDYLND